MVPHPLFASPSHQLQALGDDGDRNDAGVIVQLPLPEHINPQMVPHSCVTYGNLIIIIIILIVIIFNRPSVPLARPRTWTGCTLRTSARLCWECTCVVCAACVLCVVRSINAVVVVGNSKGGFLPCTPAGVLQALQRSRISLEGQHVVVVGRSKLVGLPLANMLIGTQDKNSHQPCNAPYNGELTLVRASCCVVRVSCRVVWRVVCRRKGQRKGRPERTDGDCRALRHGRHSRSYADGRHRHRTHAHNTRYIAAFCVVA
jgi:hypothetical protein